MGCSQMALAQFHLPKIWDGGRQVVGSNPAGYIGFTKKKRKERRKNVATNLESYKLLWMKAKVHGQISQRVVP